MTDASLLERRPAGLEPGRAVPRPAKPPRAREKVRPIPMLAPMRRRIKRAVLRVIDRGWFGRIPLRGHLVICGFPRSGTTLLQLMAQTAVPASRSYNQEKSGLGVAHNYWPGRHPYLITKRPDDVFWIDEIREFYAQRGTRTRVRFVVCVRDPRAVLTSRHDLNRNEYWVGVDRWRATYEHLRYAAQFPDVLVVEFADLVGDVATVQQRITDLMGWTVSSNFEDFHAQVPPDFDTAALNGVRSLDRNTLQRWARPEHADRIRQLLRDMPELPQRLIEMGYERDDAWTAPYR